MQALHTCVALGLEVWGWMVPVTLEEEQIAGKAGPDNPKERENTHITPSLRPHWPGEDRAPD